MLAKRTSDAMVQFVAVFEDIIDGDGANGDKMKFRVVKIDP